ncbi:hypothetical protein DL89DRAFT_141101 [Linderina pennispora]|uniref:Uncharacterized protein n=1 Tax=Linderina pennispora TaxID=61395 RepID=A0A1Y1WBX0_9FUNG|nr:uncharacterized protein DL89DRAFT_141101 [Linderina pennispora]ORX70818.1 hypothetical protein DL89DRAFT_141101 [Linderina pennispora]
MAAFNDIHGRALRQILFYAISGFSPLYSPTEELRNYFSPAWVCREWRRVLLPRLYNYAFFTITSHTPTSGPLVIRSNIRLTVENGLSKYTQRLFIIVPEGFIASGRLVEFLNEELFNKTTGRPFTI